MSVQVPEQIPLSDLGINLSDDDSAMLGAEIIDLSDQILDCYLNSTSRDKRSFGWMRKTKGLLDPNASRRLSPRAISLVSEIYVALREPTAERLNRDLIGIVGKFAAIGHVYLPGDGPGEGHVDYLTSTTLNLAMPTAGGNLIVARDPYADYLEQIRDEAFIITPIPGNIAIFDGTTYPHYVESVPEYAEGARVSINFTYGHEIANADIYHPRNLR